MRRPAVAGCPRAPPSRNPWPLPTRRMTAEPATSAPDTPPLLGGVYRLGPDLDDRAGVERFAATRVTARGAAAPVIVLRVPAAAHDPAAHPTWPSLAWEAE